MIENPLHVDDSRDGGGGGVESTEETFTRRTKEAEAEEDEASAATITYRFRGKRAIVVKLARRASRRLIVRDTKRGRGGGDKRGSETSAFSFYPSD